MASGIFINIARNLKTWKTKLSKLKFIKKLRKFRKLIWNNFIRQKCFTGWRETPLLWILNSSKLYECSYDQSKNYKYAFVHRLKRKKNMCSRLHIPRNVDYSVFSLRSLLNPHVNWSWRVGHFEKSTAREFLHHRGLEMLESSISEGYNSVNGFYFGCQFFLIISYNI